MVLTIREPETTLVRLEHLFHRNAKQIAIHFPKDETLIALVRKIPGRAWSQSHKCWKRWGRYQKVIMIVLWQHLGWAERDVDVAQPHRHLGLECQPLPEPRPQLRRPRQGRAAHLGADTHPGQSARERSVDALVGARRRAQIQRVVELRRDRKS